jgi:putative ABC transport system permease protein
MRHAPPRLGDSILRLVVSQDDAETISGDLEEVFHEVAAHRGRLAAVLWHARQLGSIVWAHLFRRSTDPIERQPRRTVMAAFRQDLFYAARSLRKQPGFAATAVLMLAIGIGANVAIFSLVNAVLLKPLPFAEPAGLMIVHMAAPELDNPGVIRRMIWSYPKYLLFRDHQQVFESTAAFSSWTWNITGTDSPERAIGELVEATYFQTLGINPEVGRTFTADETRAPGSVPLAVLGHGFWTRRFGGDRGVVGRDIGLNGIPHTIVGVLPPGFRGLTGQAEIWVPITTLSAGDLGEKWNHSYTVVARRNADVSVAGAQAAVTVLGEMVAREIPDPGGRGGNWGAAAVPLNDERTDPLLRRSLLLLLVAVASVLLLVCINVGNLTFGRALARQREVAIRLALGASRLRIVRQLMTESLLLAILSALAGLAVASLLVSVGTSMMPDLRMVLPPRSQAAGLTRVGLGGVGPDAGVLLFTFAIALVAAGLFGLAPAWRVSRRDLTDAMKRGSAGSVSTGTRGVAVRNLMVVAEMALALVLLTAGGLMLKSVVKLQATELGFNPSSLLTVRFTLPSPKYTPQRATQFFDELVGRLAAQPHVTSVAYGSCPPVSGGCNGTVATFPGRPPAPPDSRPVVGVLWASPKYFDTLGIRVVRGRAFTEHDRVGQPKVVVINETAARAFWGTEDPVGKRIAVGQGGFGGEGAEVVGVVADVRYGAVETSVNPDVYIPLLQSTRTWGYLFIRSGAPAATLVPGLRADVRALDSDLPLTDIRMMEERFGDATWRTRMGAWLLGLFAALGLLLAALGVYGVMSQGVQQRTREIGVRIALGAARGDIMQLIIGRVVRISLAGIALGILLAVPAMRLLTTLLYQVRPGDPAVFAALAFILLSVALLAGYLPARRATRVDPLTTLRAE